MSVEIIRDVLLWCSIINFVILLYWSAMFLFLHDFVYRMHLKFIKLSVEQLDEIHYKGILFYKTIIFFFNIIPYIALLIVCGA
ncbi:DUF6868 family protein [Candidatus Latescibacterota bacterium]